MDLYDMSYVPTKKYGENKLRYDWQNSVGSKIGIRKNNSYVYYEIKKYNTKTGEITLSDNNGGTNTLNRWVFKSKSKDVAANKITKEHLFEENTEINGYFIIKQIRIPHPKNKNCTIKGYTVRCLKCGEIFDLSENNLLRKQSGYCKYCSPRCTKGANDMWTTNPELAKFLKNQEDGYKYKMNCSNKILEWICPSCGEIIYASPNTVLNHGLTCRRCSDKISLPERIMYNILRSLNINFEYQKTLPKKSFIFDGKEYTPLYDFYFELNNNMYIIEMDGGFHEKVHTSSNMSIEKINEIDKNKDILADENNCILVRICANPSKFDFVYNNVLSNEILNSLFDFSMINKNEILEYCCKNNMTKEISEYYDGVTKNMHDIAKHFGVTYSFVYNSLKNGSELGWTTYNPEKQIEIMHGIKNVHSVICNELSLIFKTPKILSEKSEQYLGTQITQDEIYVYFTKHRGDINGYTFTYIPYEKCEEIEKILPNIVIN